jgi:hypothetical protein
MFGWLAPKPPISTLEKTWTESRMCWLAERLGIDRLLRAEVLVPADGSFPLPYRGTEDDVRRVLGWLCDAMQVNPSRVGLEICDAIPSARQGAVGQYEYGEQRAVVRVLRSQLEDPQKLAATLAHELAHELLIGGGLLTTDVSDHEDLTDLLPVFLGAGLFAANCTLEEKYKDTGTWSSWRIGKQGYLPARVFGYAFALFAFLRDEDRPSWAGYLRRDAAEPFQKGLAYLRRTNDSLFRPDTARSACRPPGPDEAISRLCEGTPTVQLKTLWDLRDNPPARADLVAAVADALRHRDPDIPGEAARTLAYFGEAADPAVPALLDRLWADSPATRAGAAFALGALRLRPEVVIPELCELLTQKNPDVLAEAATALYRFGEAAAAAGPRLVAALVDRLRACDHRLIDLLAATLVATSSDPIGVVRASMEDEDEEFLGWALQAVQEAAAASRSRPPGWRGDPGALGEEKPLG